MAGANAMEASKTRVADFIGCGENGESNATNLKDELSIQQMKATQTRKELTSAQRETLFATLKARFEKNKQRHAGLNWDRVQARLEAAKGKLWSLSEMERTGGEPDVIGQDTKTGEFIFVD